MKSHKKLEYSFFHAEVEVDTKVEGVGRRLVEGEVDIVAGISPFGKFSFALQPCNFFFAATSCPHKHSTGVDTSIPLLPYHWKKEPRLGICQRLGM